MAAAGVVANCIAEAELLTDDSELVNLAQASLTAANNLAPATVTDFSLAFSGLKVALRFDLHDHPLPTPEERQAAEQFLLSTRTPDGLMHLHPLPPQPPAPEGKSAWWKIRRPGARS